MTASLDRMALSATLHCLTGCAIGEVAGHGGPPERPVAVVASLAFVFGVAVLVAEAL